MGLAFHLLLPVLFFLILSLCLSLSLIPLELHYWYAIFSYFATMAAFRPLPVIQEARLEHDLATNLIMSLNFYGATLL